MVYHRNEKSSHSASIVKSPRRVDAHAVIVIDRTASRLVREREGDDTGSGLTSSALIPLPNGLNIPSDLIQVRKVVTGQHSQHHGQGLGAAFVVLAGTAQIRG